jgi:hypothetical protein
MSIKLSKNRVFKGIIWNRIALISVSMTVDPKEDDVLIPNLTLTLPLVVLLSLILPFICYKAWN